MGPPVGARVGVGVGARVGVGVPGPVVGALVGVGVPGPGGADVGVGVAPGQLMVDILMRPVAVTLICLQLEVAVFLKVTTELVGPTPVSLLN